MSETIEKPAKIARQKKSGDTPKRASTPKPRKTGPNLSDFRTWLTELGQPATPTVHVNGILHGNVVLVVDFGVPLAGVKLTPENIADLTVKMKAIVVDMALPKVVSPRVHSDSQNGIWWASLS